MIGKHIIDTTTQVKTEKDLIKVVSWNEYVMIKRSSYKKVQSDASVMESIDQSLKRTGMIGAQTLEKLSDKMIFYYLHYLLHNDKTIKTYFYNNYINLLTEMVKLGYKTSDFSLTQEIAREEYKTCVAEVDKMQKILKEKSHMLVLREISRRYEQLRLKNLPYGEHAENVLSFIVTHCPVHFY